MPLDATPPLPFCSSGPEHPALLLPPEAEMRNPLPHSRDASSEEAPQLEPQAWEPDPEMETDSPTHQPGDRGGQQSTGRQAAGAP